MEERPTKSSDLAAGDSARHKVLLHLSCSPCAVRGVPLWYLALLAMVAICCARSDVPAAPAAKAPTYCFGVLQADPAHAAQDAQAGIRLATLEVSWNRYEPRPGQFDARYLATVRRKADALRGAGMQLVLDLGLQYPPPWLFALPHSRFVNQYGDAYDLPQPGKQRVNAVFNQALRDREDAYVTQVFADLGRDFFAVRLGWGYYGELNLPLPKFNGHVNCFWAFDDLAQGKAPGLPPGLPPCPQPGWVPGTHAGPSGGHRAAAEFMDWYCEALRNWQDWQVATVRKSYAGRLAILYPSWGLRPGGLAGAVAHDLEGSTSPELNGETQRAFDFARLVNAIRDPQVIVYTTWIDAHPPGTNDAGDNPARWSPARYLASLADAHPLHLGKWGENTGRGDVAAMELSFRRMRDNGMLGLMWAFEPDLYDGQHATLEDYARLIRAEAVPALPVSGP